MRSSPPVSHRPENFGHGDAEATMIEVSRLGKNSEITHPWVFVPTRGGASASNGSSSRQNSAIVSCPVHWTMAVREKSPNAWTSSASNQGGSTALASKPSLRQQPRGISDRRHRRLGRRPRRLQETFGRASGRQRHGLHHRAAPRPEPRQHAGGSACGSYVDAGLAGDGRNGDRARARLCHSAWRLSLGRRQGSLAAFEAAGATWRAAPFRLPVEFSGSRIWRARRLRGPFGNRRRRQPRSESSQG